MSGKIETVTAERFVIVRKDPWAMAIVHREDCHMVRHQVDNDPRPADQPVYEQRIVERYEDGSYRVQDAQRPAPARHYTPIYVTTEELAHTLKYRGCRVCSPDVPQNKNTPE